jgi:hypothetical protein
VVIISIGEIILVLATAGIIYDLYHIFKFDLSHYKRGIKVSAGVSPWHKEKEFPSNYKMIYKADNGLYKFVGPTTLVFRHEYEGLQIKNIVLAKGVGELKDGKIYFTARFGLLTPGIVSFLLCYEIFISGTNSNAQEIIGLVFILLLLIANYFYSRIAADKLAQSVSEKLLL